MTSENNIYPPLLLKYVKPQKLKLHSMNHNCLLNKFGIIKEELGEEVWTVLKDSSLGVFLKLSEVEYTWAAQRVHWLLKHQLAVNNIHELWFLVGGQPIRFSLNEWAEMTGLNCDPIDEGNNCMANHESFWADLGLDSPIGPTFLELRKVMDCCKAWSLEKKVMVGRLCILSVGVFGIHQGSRIDFESARRVLEPDAFEKYPWGRVAFTTLIESIKVQDYRFV